MSGKTPEELEEIYKNWQRAYTKKRQAEKAELEEYRKRLEELEKQQTGKFKQLTEEEFSRLSPEEQVQYIRQQVEQEKQIEQENAYIEAQEKTFYSLDPRLNEDSPDYDPVFANFVNSRLSEERDKFEAVGKSIIEFDFIGKAKDIIKDFENYLQSRTQKYLQKQKKIARTRSEDFAKQSPQTVKGKAKPKSLDLDEALEAAMQG